MGRAGRGTGTYMAGKLPGAELPFLNPSLEHVGLASMQGELLLIHGFRWNGAFSYLQCSWPPAFNLHFWIKNFLFAMILGCYELQWGGNRAAGCFSSWVLVSLLPQKGQLFLTSGAEPGRRLSPTATSPRQGRGPLPAQT